MRFIFFALTTAHIVPIPSNPEALARAYQNHDVLISKSFAEELKIMDALKPEPTPAPAPVPENKVPVGVARVRRDRDREISMRREGSRQLVLCHLWKSSWQDG
jgi:hypothetical protein